VPRSHPCGGKIVVGFLNLAAKVEVGVPPEPLRFSRHRSRVTRDVNPGPPLEFDQSYFFAPQGFQVLAAVREAIACAASKEGHFIKDFSSFEAARALEIGTPATKGRIPPDQAHAFSEAVFGAHHDTFRAWKDASFAHRPDMN
jgi:hypothetical protein